MEAKHQFKKKDGGQTNKPHRISTVRLATSQSSLLRTRSPEHGRRSPISNANNSIEEDKQQHSDLERHSDPSLSSHRDLLQSYYKSLCLVDTRFPISSDPDPINPLLSFANNDGGAGVVVVMRRREAIIQEEVRVHQKKKRRGQGIFFQESQRKKGREKEMLSWKIKTETCHLIFTNLTVNVI